MAESTVTTTSLSDIIKELQEHGVGSTTINNLVAYMARGRWEATKQASADGEWPTTKTGFADELGKHKDRLCGLSAAIVGMRQAIGREDIRIDGVQRIALDAELSAMKLQHIYSAVFDRATG
ncbi:hypothetical protein OGR47_05065 [Methylocystis sp. MJC1]|jgi:hypothetical protein|uniref:hypothetical protein n=1 Tax=Methylocystis sp. MJC1 TaxID=2654282 RepID=UPI0013EA905A|nr:hypothetical protein [Methylocystis sp. MJC1]KAF2989731.1 hypothetical protein MJC1_03076 [Methylocystis sp. MJC1]MBU6526380.1 hypothetical protein [Methylocystis sp. MJC1]UZX12827.1 hypothetical protein OGR47_05065 [Methylocystis sp. MJC1]